MIAAALDLLFPPRCVACAAPALGPVGAFERAFCLDCLLGVEAPSPSACQLCGTEQTEGAGPCCFGCLGRPPPWKRLRAALIYGGPTLEAIHGVKFGRHEERILPLTKAFVAQLGGTGDASDGQRWLLPVPTHPAHLRARGFDLPDALAEAYALALGFPMIRTAVRRVGAPGTQVGRSLAARHKAVRSAFGPGLRPSTVRGKDLLVIDDVTTTGATLRALAGQLLKQGARSLEVAVLARAP